jgi:hypothetical protein
MAAKAASDQSGVSLGRLSSPFSIEASRPRRRLVLRLDARGRRSPWTIHPIGPLRCVLLLRRTFPAGRGGGAC